MTLFKPEGKEDFIMIDIEHYLRKITKKNRKFLEELAR